MSDFTSIFKEIFEPAKKRRGIYGSVLVTLVVIMTSHSEEECTVDMLILGILAVLTLACLTEFLTKKFDRPAGLGSQSWKNQLRKNNKKFKIARAGYLVATALFGGLTIYFGMFTPYSNCRDQLVTADGKEVIEHELKTKSDSSSAQFVFHNTSPFTEDSITLYPFSQVDMDTSGRSYLTVKMQTLSTRGGIKYKAIIDNHMLPEEYRKNLWDRIRDSDDRIIGGIRYLFQDIIAHGMRELYERILPAAQLMPSNRLWKNDLLSLLEKRAILSYQLSVLDGLSVQDRRMEARLHKARQLSQSMRNFSGKPRQYRRDLRKLNRLLDKLIDGAEREGIIKRFGVLIQPVQAAIAQIEPNPKNKKPAKHQSASGEEEGIARASSMSKGGVQSTNTTSKEEGWKSKVKDEWQEYLESPSGLENSTYSEEVDHLPIDLNATSEDQGNDALASEPPSSNKSTSTIRSDAATKKDASMLDNSTRQKSIIISKVSPDDDNYIIDMAEIDDKSDGVSMPERDDVSDNSQDNNKKGNPAGDTENIKNNQPVLPEETLNGSIYRKDEWYIRFSDGVCETNLFNYVNKEKADYYYEVRTTDLDGSPRNPYLRLKEINSDPYDPPNIRELRVKRLNDGKTIVVKEIGEGLKEKILETLHWSKS